MSFGNAGKPRNSFVRSHVRAFITISTIGAVSGLIAGLCLGVTSLIAGQKPEWLNSALGACAIVAVAFVLFLDHCRGLLAEEESNQRADESMAELQREPGLEPLTTAQAEVLEKLLARQFSKQARSSNRLWWASLAGSFVTGFIVNWTSTPLLAWLAKAFSA